MYVCMNVCEVTFIVDQAGVFPSCMSGFVLDADPRPWLYTCLLRRQQYWRPKFMVRNWTARSFGFRSLFKINPEQHK